MMWRLVCNVNYKISYRSKIDLLRRDVLKDFVLKNAPKSLKSTSTDNINSVDDKTNSEKSEENDGFITIYS